jgi:HAD superfamily phosphatase (TIGR01668 family)
MLRLLVPHLRLQTVCQLTLARLGDLGLEALLLDVDCTLKRFRDERPAAEVVAWLEELRRGGIGLCLVSNGLDGRVRRFAEKLDLPYVSTALKPFPLGCRAALRKMKFPPERTAMVGDQVFADVMAARLAGLMSILVRPIHPEDEPWFTRLKRGPERYLLGRMNVAEEQAGGQ